MPPSLNVNVRPSVPITAVTRGLARQVDALVNNTVDDIREIYGATSQCLAQVDRIRTQLTNRALEYATTVTQIAAEEIFRDVNQIFNAVAPQIRRDPRPALFTIGSKNGFFHEGVGTSLHTLAALNDLDNQVGSSLRHAVFLIHGMGYKRTEDLFRSDALRLFAHNFETEARIFKQGPRFDVEYFIVNWDSELLDEDANKILAAIAAASLSFGSAVPAAVIYAVQFRELERRAKQVAGYLMPFIRRLHDTHRHVKVHAVTHSLGSLVWAELMDGLEKSGFFNTLPAAQGRGIGVWWNLQSAIPNDSFSRQGPFLQSIGPYFAVESRVRTWHSHADIVLSSAYVFAKQALALGQYGNGNSRGDILVDTNVTQLSGEAHGETPIIGPTGYFPRIGTAIRKHLADFRIP